MANYSKTILIICSLVKAAILFAQDTTSAHKDPLYFVEKVDIEAEYPEGANAWNKYIQNNVRNKLLESNAPVGKYTAIVRFIVDTSGIINSTIAETKYGFGMEEEIERVIKNSRKWKPAMKNNRPVKAYRRQPITFLKESADFTILTKEPYTLYADFDNEITVEARKVAPEDISVSVAGGEVIAKKEGRFLVRVSKSDRVILEITNTKKNNKLIGSVSMVVKYK